MCFARCPRWSPFSIAYACLGFLWADLGSAWGQEKQKDEIDPAKVRRLQYRCSRDSFAPSRYVIVTKTSMSFGFTPEWDLPKESGKAKQEFDLLIKMLEGWQINGAEFEWKDAWVGNGFGLRITSVPQLTKEGKDRIAFDLNGGTRKDDYSRLFKMPLHGTLYKNKVYGFFGTENGDFGLSAIDYKNPASPLWARYRLPGGGRANGQDGLACSLRHHIGHDCIWISHGPRAIRQLKLDELHLYDLQNENGMRQYVKKYKGAGYAEYNGFQLLFSYHRPGYTDLQPFRRLEQASNKLGQTFNVTSAYGKTFLDLISKTMAGIGSAPTSIDHCKCFMLPKKTKEFEIWDSEFAWDKDENRWYATKESYNVEKIPSLFVEDFYFFLHKQDYYFVTESGKLFCANPPKSGEKSRTMRELWGDASRPIVAIIEDADVNKVWLFAKNKNVAANEIIVFEMKDPGTSERYDAAKVRPVSIDGRVKTVLEYLHLIY